MTTPAVGPGDRAAIVDLNARVAWALDRHAYDELRELFTPDAHYVSVGREFADVEAIIASFAAREPGRTTRHGVGNLVLEPAGPDRVTGLGSWHTFASNHEPAGVPVVFMVADFADVYVRAADGAWRIAERVITPVFRDPELGPDRPRTRGAIPPGGSS